MPNETAVTKSELKVTPEIVKALRAPLPPESIKPHPTKSHLSSIKVIYVVERLNEVFGLGGWFVDNEIIKEQVSQVPRKSRDKTELRNANGDVIMREITMVIVKAVLTIPAYGIRVEAFGGNDNEDLGDAYKGACTDALSKIGSYLYVGMDVYKGNPYAVPEEPTKALKPEPQPLIGIVKSVTPRVTEDGENQVWIEVDDKRAVHVCVADSEPNMGKLLDSEGAALELLVEHTGKLTPKAKKAILRVYQVFPMTLEKQLKETEKLVKA